MLATDYIYTLETNTMVLGILTLAMKDFTTQIIRHIHSGGTYDDAAFARLRTLCIRNLKNTQVEGAPLHQEVAALNQALELFQQMTDDSIARGKAQPR